MKHKQAARVHRGLAQLGHPSTATDLCQPHNIHSPANGPRAPLQCFLKIPQCAVEHIEEWKKWAVKWFERFLRTVRYFSVFFYNKSGPSTESIVTDFNPKQSLECFNAILEALVAEVSIYFYISSADFYLFVYFKYFSHSQTELFCRYIEDTAVK